MPEAEIAYYLYGIESVVNTFTTVCYIISALFTIYYIVLMWLLFVKAGEAGWKALIPGYNLWVLYSLVYNAGWKMFLLFVPFYGIAVAIMTMIRMAQAYGHGIGMGLLNLFVPPVGMSILAFSKNTEYIGPINRVL